MPRTVPSLATLLLLAPLLGTPTARAEAAPDHFLCYRSKSVAGTPKLVPRPGMAVLDALGARAVHVFREERLCAPTDKNGESPTAPAHPDHLRGYQLRKVTPHVDRVHGVAVVDQFGPLVLDLVKLDRLLVPARVSATATPPPPAPPAIDHFACYRIRRSPSSERFSPGAGVTLTDAFGTLALDVLKPQKLCLPVDKNDEAPGAEQHEGLLVCYKVRRAADAPRFRRVTPLFTQDQIDPLVMDARRPEEICVPATRVLP